MAKMAKRRLKEWYEGGEAFGIMEGGRAVLRFGGEGEVPTPPRAASVAGYRRQRESALALKARQRTMRGRAAQGPETPAQALARMLNIDETMAYHAVRNPYMGQFVRSKMRHRQRLGELDRMQEGRMEAARYGGKLSKEMLGEQLGYKREALGVTEKIAAATVKGQYKRALAGLVQRRAEEKGRTDRAAIAAEATAGSAAGKAATRKTEQAAAAKAKDVAAKDKVEQEKLQREYDRLSGHRDNLVKRLEKQESLTDPAEGALEAARKNLRKFDAKGDLEKAYKELQEFQPTPTAKPEGEAAPGQPAAPAAATTTQPAGAPQYQTSAEAITAIKSGEFDINAPGSEDIFLSLPPQVQEEVRAWLRKSGYLD